MAGWAYPNAIALIIPPLQICAGYETLDHGLLSPGWESEQTQ